MSAEQKFAEVFWTPSDLQTLRPDWDLEKCADWLAENERYIQPQIVELGWDVLAALLGSEWSF